MASSTTNCQVANVCLSILWYNPEVIPRKDNPLLQLSYVIVKILQKRLAFNGITLPSCPLWNNRLFTAGGKPLKNNVWLQHNIKQAGQVIRNGNMVPFDELKTQFGLKDSELFSYLQIKSSMKSIPSKGLDIGNKIELEDK